MKKFFINLAIVAITSFCFISCPMVNEPDEEDYMNLSDYYYVRILNKNLVGGTWYFEHIGNDVLHMVSPEGIDYIFEIK